MLEQVAPPSQPKQQLDFLGLLLVGETHFEIITGKAKSQWLIALSV